MSWSLVGVKGLKSLCFAKYMFITQNYGIPWLLLVLVGMK